MMTDYCFAERMDCEPNKMMGYLEKKVKMLGWRRYWFVLDGRLLTYYKSQLEYQSLSACCGSINLGIAINVSPIQATNSRGFPLQIVTRTQVYFLRAGEKSELNHWLIAIQEGVEIPPRISSVPIIPHSVTTSLARNNFKPDPKHRYAQDLDGGPDRDTHSARLESLHPLTAYSLSTLSLSRSRSQSQSQWSLNTSVEDLTNWTIAGCSGPSALENPKNLPRHQNILKKYCSLASLHFKSQSDLRSFTKYTNNNNYYSNYSSNQKSKTFYDPYTTRDKNINNNPNRKIDEMQEIIPRNKTNFTKVRNTSSMLVLGTGSGSGSGSLSSSSTNSSQTNHGFNHNLNHNLRNNQRKSTLSFPTLPVTTPVVERLVTWDNTCQSRTATVTANMKRHSHSNSDTIIDNIYTNTSDNMSSVQGQSQGQIQGQGLSKTLPRTGATLPINHDYDEILDLKGKNGKNPSEGVYENIDNDRNEDPWEKLPTNQGQNQTPNQGQGQGQLPSSSSSSLRSRKSPQNQNALVSIEEAPEKSQKTNTLSKVDDHHQSKRKDSTDSTKGNTLKKNEASASDTKNASKKRKKPSLTSKKSFSGFFHKIFHKGDKKKNQQQTGGDDDKDKDKDNKDMVITGPVDLRRHTRDQKLNAAISSRQTYTFTPEMGTPYTQSLASKAGIAANLIESQNQQFHINSMKNIIKPAIGTKSDAGSNEDLLEELNKKFGERKRHSGGGDTPSHERISTRTPQGQGQGQSQGQGQGQEHQEGDSAQNPDHRRENQILRKKFSGNDIPHYTIKVNQHMSMTHAPTRRPSINIPKRAVSVNTSDSEEFLRKLAHFNRLSASLDPTFVAAVSTLRSSFTNSNNFGISRSNSLRVRSSVLEEPPVLPPKRRQIPTTSMYDTPMNNSPVVVPSDSERFDGMMHDSADPNPNFSTLRELTKKYSAPDISFNNSGGNELTVFCSKDSTLLRKSFDIQLQPSYNSSNSNGNGNGSSGGSNNGVGEVLSIPIIGALPLSSSSSSSSPPPNFIPPPRPPKSNRNSENCDPDSVQVPALKAKRVEATNDIYVSKEQNTVLPAVPSIHLNAHLRSEALVKTETKTDPFKIINYSKTPNPESTAPETPTINVSPELSKEQINHDEVTIKSLVIESQQPQLVITSNDDQSNTEFEKVTVIKKATELENNDKLPEDSPKVNDSTSEVIDLVNVGVDAGTDATGIDSVTKVLVIDDKYYILPAETKTPVTIVDVEKEVEDQDPDEQSEIEGVDTQISSVLTLSVLTSLPGDETPLLQENKAEELEIENESDQEQTTDDLEDIHVPKEEINQVIEQSRTNEIKIIQPPVPVRHHAEVLLIDLPKMQTLEVGTDVTLTSTSLISNASLTPIPTPTPSPTWSQKSVDIDSLEVLSDISSVSATASHDNGNPSPQVSETQPENPVPAVPVSVQTEEISGKNEGLESSICDVNVGQGNESEEEKDDPKEPTPTSSTPTSPTPAICTHVEPEEIIILDAGSQVVFTDTIATEKLNENIDLNCPETTDDVPTTSTSGSGSSQEACADQDDHNPTIIKDKSEDSNVQEEKKETFLLDSETSEKIEPKNSEPDPVIETAEAGNMEDHVPKEEKSNPVEIPAPFKVHYATVNAVAWETVQETEEELNELYDEFPADVNFTFPATATPIMSEMDLVQMDSNDFLQDKDTTIRQSGFEELQAFLFNEENQEGACSNSDSETHSHSHSISKSKSNNSMIMAGGGSSRSSSRSSSHSVGSVSNASSTGSTTTRGPAVNRLGHSSAVEQLKKLFDGDH